VYRPVEQPLTPRLACEAFARAINGQDLEGALGCFAPGACLIWAGGEAAHGERAIRARLGELIAAGAQLEIELLGVLVAADLALAHERWAISHADVPDPSLGQTPSPTLVLRCLAGEWKLAIAAPWGKPAKEPQRMIWP
jgi:ketosteroid isomerase-like protein